MRGLCRELGLSYDKETRDLDAPAYSKKIGDLLEAKRQKQTSNQEVSTCSRYHAMHLSTHILIQKLFISIGCFSYQQSASRLPGSFRQHFCNTALLSLNDL